MTSSNKYCPSHIANYFLWKAEEEGFQGMTPMKLIKLTYFSYAWHLAIFNEPLFKEKIEAWKYGPVIPSLYHEFKEFGSGAIKKYAVNFDMGRQKFVYPTVKQEDKNILKVLSAIWEVYKNESGKTLSDIAHFYDSPWEKVYVDGENNSLKDEDIKPRVKEAILKHDDTVG